jgi:hypothetical protein
LGFAWHRLAYAVAAFIIALAPTQSFAADPISAAYCAKVGDEDTLHSPPANLSPALKRAFAHLQGGGAPDDAYLQANAQTRCMDGKLLVCFVGANLPCGKINATRDNPGATAWCREHPGDKIIPLVATGHDTLYSYECDGANARVTKTNLVLDRRGFAAKLWTPLD